MSKVNLRYTGDSFKSQKNRIIRGKEKNAADFGYSS